MSVIDKAAEAQKLYEELNEVYKMYSDEWTYLIKERVAKVLHDFEIQSPEAAALHSTPVSEPVALQVERKDELFTDDELFSIVEKIVSDQYSADQMGDIVTKMGMLRQFINDKLSAAPPSVATQENDVPTSSQTIAKPNVVCCLKSNGT